MCGRARLADDWSEIKIQLKFDQDAPSLLAPTGAMAEIHNRMPCILGESDWAKWLGEEPASAEELLALLKRCPNEWLEIFPVDKKVGNVRNKGADLVLPIDLR